MRYFILAPIAIAFTLLAYLLAPILPLFANNEGWLPDWLWRNPAYGFDNMLGFIRTDEQLHLAGTINLDGLLTQDGWFFATCGYAWQLYITHHWNDTHTTKINLGWKLWGDNPHQLVCSIGVWKSIQ